jgi:hypothetical protein
MCPQICPQSAPDATPKLWSRADRTGVREIQKSPHLCGLDADVEDVYGSRRTSVQEGNGGAEGDRTLDLRIANATLSQLSYRPTIEAAKSSIRSQTGQPRDCARRRSAYDFRRYK